MTRAAPGEQEALLGDLRHRLRTPLNHILGYSDLLLEDSAIPGIEDRLNTIRESAQVILALIQKRLTLLHGESACEQIDTLRGEIGEPLSLIVRNAAVLAQNLEGPALLDLVRINTATADLLAFAQRADTTARAPASVHGPDLRRNGPATIPARVLVVDDNETNCDMLLRQLSRDGHGVTSVHDGLRAIRELASGRFDLVLLDVMMPGVSGFEVLAQIRADPELSAVPVIMMSALDELETAARCIQMGAEDYLLKPCDPILLKARLHSTMERRRLHEMEQERRRELEKVTRDLRRANDDLHRFAYAASHDLQEPLRTMSTVLEMFAQQYRPEPGASEPDLLNLAIDASRHMSQLISDLLAYSVASGDDRAPVTVDAEAALEEAVSNLRKSIEDSGAVITHDPLPRVLYEPAQFCIVFQNLIGNAIKYRGENRPEIHIATVHNGEDWIFSVRDNGMGIDPQYRDQIFEPFRRLHGHELPGTGLGLAICRRSLEGFGGHIWVESAPDQGSTFYFSLRAAH